MELTYIGLSEYYRKFIPKAKEKKYIWVISLIARYADAEKLYDKLESDWASLNDLTNNKILFIFSSPEVRKRASFLHRWGKASYVGYMCPFIEVLNGEDVEDNRGEFEYMYHDYKKVDWKQKHSQAVSEVAEDFDIPEEQIPCMFIWNIKNDKRKVIPVSSDTDIYTMIKDIVIKVKEYNNILGDVELRLDKYKNIDNYYSLYRKLETLAMEIDPKQGEAIMKVLSGEKEYKYAKDIIKDNNIKKDLKRIGQWKKHFLTIFEDSSLAQEEYYSLKNTQQEVLKQIDLIWDNAPIDKCDKKKSSPRILKDKILNDLVLVCLNLQANSTYNNAKENDRNDYVRDLLETSGYDAKDQTRRGHSTTRKQAGEVDILIKENGFPIAVIEALNLKSLEKGYLGKHIEKIYNYDTAGNSFNVILSYVKVADFSRFCSKYVTFLKNHKYPYPLISLEDNIQIGNNSYTDIRIIKTSHERSEKRTDLFHICVLFS